MLDVVEGAAVGIQGLVLAVDGPVEDVLLIGELVVADGVARHVKLVGGDDPGWDVEQRDDFHILVLIDLDGVVGGLLILQRDRELGGVNQRVKLRIGQNRGVAGGSAVVAVVELAQRQSVGACKAEVPVNCGVHTVRGRAPQQNGQVVGQELELHVHADISPVGLDSRNGVKQVAGVVHSLQGIAAVPAGLSQKLSGQIRVVIVLGQTVGLPEAFRNQRLVGRDNGVVPQGVHYGIHVNGIPKRLADTNILQGIRVRGTAHAVCGCGERAEGEDNTQCENQAKQFFHRYLLKKDFCAACSQHA